MRFQVIDLETTGLRPSADRILEVATVDITRFCGAGGVAPTIRQLRAKHFMFDPEMPIPPAATKIHGIESYHVAWCKTFREQAEELYAVLKDSILIGHHIQFDVSFLSAEFSRAGIKFVPTRFCTLDEARSLLPGLVSHKLETLNEHFGLSKGRAHRAKTDAKTTALLYFKLQALRTSLPPPPAAPASAPAKSPRGASKSIGASPLVEAVKAPPKKTSSRAYKKAVSAMKAQLKALGS